MPNQIQIFDTTLRDGEQVPGCQLNAEEKVEVAQQLESLGVDCIEAGFPVSSPADFQSIVEVTKAVKDPVICVLSRPLPDDIACAAESLQHAKRGRINIILSTSDVHIEKQLRTTREAVHEQAIASVKRAKKHNLEVQFCAMDAGRTDLGFLTQIVEDVIKAGASIVSLPDTIGYCLPDEYGNIFRHLMSEVPSIDSVLLSAHCHNDLGLATSNSLAALQNGAGQIEGTINGVGERAGNAALEEIIMIIHTRLSDAFQTGINTRQIAATSSLVSQRLRMAIQPNKAIVGAHAFAHSSGIHQHGILKHRKTYELLDPEVIGLARLDIILNARSGRAALIHRLERLGFQLSKEDLSQIYPHFITLADTRHEVDDDDLRRLMEERYSNKSER